jgi:hypothetical protein
LNRTSVSLTRYPKNANIIQELKYGLFCCACCRGITNNQVLVAGSVDVTACELVLDPPRTFLAPSHIRLVLIHSSFKVVDNDGLDLKYFRQEVCHISQTQNSRHYLILTSELIRRNAFGTEMISVLEQVRHLSNDRERQRKRRSPNCQNWALRSTIDIKRDTKITYPTLEFNFLEFHPAV